MSAQGLNQIVQNGLILYLDAANTKSYSNDLNWIDLTKNTNGILVNGPTFSILNKGNILFDGVNDYINLGKNFNFTTQNFTFQFWVNILSFTTTQSGQGPVIFYKGDYGVNGYYFQISSGGSCYLVTSQGSGVVQTTISSTNLFTLNRWCNICITRNSNSVRIYVDGIDRTLIVGNHLNPSSAVDVNFTINKYRDTTPFIYSNIRVGMFKIYNRALLEQDIIQNFNVHKSRYM